MKNNIRKLRGDFGLTQAQLAKYLGVNRLTIVRWERGDNEISWKHIKALMEFFELNDAKELFE